MALWSRLMVNNKAVGFVEILRDAEAPHRPHRDDVCAYTVRIRYNGTVHEAEVKHRYGDGALVLLSKAFAAVTEETESV